MYMKKLFYLTAFIAAVALSLTIAPAEVNAQLGTCGPAAQSYAATETSFTGALCSFGTPTPAAPSFPAAGSSTTWTCVGTTTVTCTASRAAAGTPTTGTLDPWGGKKTEIQTGTGLGDTDPRQIASKVINVILGFLGIIAVVLIVAGGFMWMTAAGNDEKIGTARKIMTAGAIGLVIVLAAFGIARFVVDALVDATK